MADEAQSTDSSDSAKDHEFARPNLVSEGDQVEKASPSKAVTPQVSGGSMADTQKQRYMQRALNRSTQASMPKFTANGLENMVPSAESSQIANEVQKEGTIRKVEKSSVLAARRSFFRTFALVLGIVACGCVFVFMQLKRDGHEKQPDQLRAPGLASGAAVGNSSTDKSAFYLNQAEVNIHAGNYRKAVADLKTASIKDPACKVACLERIGGILTNLGDNKSVIANSEALLTLEPNNVAALLQHAQASYRVGKKLSAREDLFRAIKLEPQNAQSYAARGAYYSAEKNYTSAELDYKHALVFDPNNRDILRKLAALRASPPEENRLTSEKNPLAHEVRNPAQLPLSMSELKQLQSSNVNALRQAGKQALNRHNFKFAVEALRRCVIINPNDPESRKLLAYSLIKAGDPSGAFDQFSAWNSIVVLDLDEQLAFGRALAKAADSETMTAFFNFLVDHHSSDAQALLSVAEAAGRAKDCAQEVDRAVNLGLKRSTGSLHNKFLVLKERLHI